MINEVRQKMYAAMKGGDKETKAVYSNILNALTNKAKDMQKADLTESEAQEVIVKQVKTLKESLDTCPKERSDIREKLNFELKITEQYMPKQMSEEEVNEVIRNVLAELGIDKPTAKDKGRIMKVLMPKVKGKVDGKIVNTILQNYFI